MNPKLIPLNKHFIGRDYEVNRLKEIDRSEKATILIVYGRRRVGKTELLEQTYRNRNVLKFEGRENQSQKYQMQRVLDELADYSGDDLLKDLQPKNWSDVFKYIHRYVRKGKWTLYFEEVQWLAQYQDDFISELKYAWDNYFRHNKQLIIILCGSSPSFMINHVARSKALYNRSQQELALDPFDFDEAQKILKKRSKKEAMDAYLSVGGIPIYLDYLKDKSSMFLSLCEHSFRKDAYFSHEYERIFISSLADNKNYREIIRFLSKKRFATREEIIHHLKIQSGKNVTELLQELELCGFIGKYVPYNVDKKSILVRYCIEDNYLQFYCKFIEPKLGDISTGKYNKNPRAAIQYETYGKWLGYAFERFCRCYHFRIAEILGFAAVNYRSGVFFNRATNKESPGYQIDLVFDRDDQVLTICEIKYSQNKITTTVIGELERKLQLFPNPKNKTIQRVLIASNGVAPSVIEKAYFDNIITVDDF